MSECKLNEILESSQKDDKIYKEKLEQSNISLSNIKKMIPIINSLIERIKQLEDIPNIMPSLSVPSINRYERRDSTVKIIKDFDKIKRQKEEKKI